MTTQQRLQAIVDCLQVAYNAHQRQIDQPCPANMYLSAQTLDRAFHSLHLKADDHGLQPGQRRCGTDQDGRPCVVCIVGPSQVDKDCWVVESWELETGNASTCVAEAGNLERLHIIEGDKVVEPGPQVIEMEMPSKN